jgi:7-cyano-7-deazaguanine synthase in queuosine biosynthesis
MTYMPGEFPNRIVSFDYDGTLVEDSFPEHGELKPEAVELIKKLGDLGYTLVVHTARQSLDADTIRETTGIQNVQTGKAVADLYIDDKGLLPLGDLTEAYIEQYFETQVDYLKKLVAGEYTSPYATNMANVPENPAHKETVDDNFKVYIPVTGGMDSVTLWQMAIESGYPVMPIYIDAGQEYAEQEIEVAQRVVAEAGHELEIINLELPFKEYKHILLGRNAAVIYTLASLMKERGQWGEIWFGNLAGESPTTGGDKSRRFFNDTQHLLSLRGFDVRVINPLLGMDKPDEVSYWQTRDIQKLIDTKSCFSASERQCGQCQTCFRKWVAFKTHGIEIRDTFAHQDIKENFAEYIEKYKVKMTEALDGGNYSHYSPSRIKSTLDAIESL